ncbi:MAG: glycosyltransferase family 2 protein [Candidatus Limnocylindrales bacterium]
MSPTDGIDRTTRTAASSVPEPGSDAPVLSVLIPCWNAAQTIGRALSSVLVEREIRLECIVVDDGSTDGTADIVQAIADRDPRVVLVRLPTNAGVSNARNRGLEVMRGEWFVGLDADDRIMPGGLAALLRPTARPGVLAVIGQRVWTDGERRWISPVYDNPDIRLPGRKSIATHPGLLYYVATVGKLLHRSLLTGLEFQGRVLGDQPWTVRALLRAGNDIEVIEDTVYEWWRPHPDHYVATITSAKQASAGRAVEMVRVATSAFAEVSAEVDDLYPDGTTRDAIKRAYLGRLARSDLGAPVRSAIDRHDPDTTRLYAEVARFLGSVPPAILASSELLVSSVLRPPAARWRELPGAARAAYWAMLRPVLRADPRSGYRLLFLPRFLPTFPAAIVVRSLETRVGQSVASVGLWVASTLWALGVALGRCIPSRHGR